MNSFTDYVSKKLDKYLWEAMEHYFQNANATCFSFPLNEIKNIGEVEIQDSEVIKVGVYEIDDSRIGFDVLYDLKLLVFDEDRYHYHKGEYKEQWYLMNCEGDLLTELTNMEVKHIEPYYAKQKRLKPMSDSLVPLIHKEQLEEYATAIVKKYCPEVLEKPMVVDPMKLVEKMGLNLIKTQITKECDIFGQIYFKDSEAEIYDSNRNENKKIPVREGTILVDENVVFQRNIGSFNNTIIHECVHWELHKKAYQLERLYNENASQIKCRVDGDIEGTGNTAMSWMEWQANALAPRIQMPFPAFKIKVSELLREYEKQLKTYNICDLMPFIIDELSIFYCVSKMSVKIRLLDAGYEEALGALIYIDDHYVAPHKCKKGFLFDNQTFSIGIEDAMFLSATDMDLYNATKDGMYLYVDSHFVLNDPKYIARDGNGNLFLTDYARYHMDECCLVFELKIKNQISDYYNKFCFLNKDKDAYVIFEPKFSGKWTKKEKDKFVDDALVDDMNLYNTLTTNFGDSIKICIKWANTTQAKLAKDCGIDKDTINKVLNGNQNPEKNTMVKMIFALHVPPNSSRFIFDNSPCKLIISKPDDAAIEFALRTMYSAPLDTVIEFLQSKGVKIEKSVLNADDYD